MNDLQNAFDWVDSGPTVVGAKHIIALADAARKYANPDYDAFHKALYEWYHSERPMSSDVEKELVAAALGVTENE